MSWWRVHYDDVRAKYKGKLWSQKVAFTEFMEGIEYLDSFNRPGLSKEQGVIHQGTNSGYQAINLAYLLGATCILLLGYDAKGKGVHWFGRHPPTLSQNGNFDNLPSYFKTINPDDYGISIINCSRDTALHFPRMTIDEAISRTYPSR